MYLYSITMIFFCMDDDGSYTFEIVAKSGENVKSRMSIPVKGVGAFAVFIE